MSIIQWQQQGKTVSLVVNKQEIKKIHYTDFSVDEKTDSFPCGVFCNPSLDKKQYLLLAKIYHPDVSSLPSQLATEITQVINSAKDGHNKNRPSSNTYQNNQSNQPKSHFSVDDFLSYCRASKTWILQRYGMKDWVHNHSSKFIVEQFSKSDVIAGVKILVKVTIYMEYGRAKVSMVEELITGFCRKTLFLKRINWELLNVSELKEIIKKECIPISVSKQKKAGLVEVLTHYFSGMGYYDNPVAGNWYFGCTHQLSLLFPDFWDDDKARQEKEEKIKKEEEKQRKEEDHNIPRYDLASWIKLKRIGYIGRDKFIQVLQRADDLFSERQPYYDYRYYPLRTDEEWRQAFDEVMKHP